MGASVCAAISLSLGIGYPGGPPAAGAVAVGGVDIVGDDEADRFVGSGAVFLPSTVSATRRQQAAWCHGCRWKVTAPCLRQDGAMFWVASEGGRSVEPGSARRRLRAGGVVLSRRWRGDVGRGDECSHPRRHRGAGAPVGSAMFASAWCGRRPRPPLPIGTTVCPARMVLHGGRPRGCRRGERDVVLGLYVAGSSGYEYGNGDDGVGPHRRLPRAGLSR